MNAGGNLAGRHGALMASAKAGSGPRRHGTNQANLAAGAGRVDSMDDRQAGLLDVCARHFTAGACGDGCAKK